MEVGGYMSDSKWDLLSKASAGAALAENSQKKMGNDKKRKLIAYPFEFEQQFELAKKEGRVIGTFSNYIVDAIRSKLKEDGII